MVKKLTARLEELQLLEDGWLEGAGTAPDGEGLQWLSSKFEQNYPHDLMLPLIYPTPEGGIQAEWTIASRDISLEIDLANHWGSWHALDLETGEETAKDINLDDDRQWVLISEEIRSFSGDEDESRDSAPPTGPSGMGSTGKNHIAGL